MGLLIGQGKIFKSVVIPYTIKVMDKFTALEASTEFLRHYEAMFKNITIRTDHRVKWLVFIYPNKDIAVPIYSPAAFPKVVSFTEICYATGFSPTIPTQPRVIRIQTGSNDLATGTAKPPSARPLWYSLASPDKCSALSLLRFIHTLPTIGTPRTLPPPIIIGATTIFTDANMFAFHRKILPQRNNNVN